MSNRTDPVRTAAQQQAADVAVLAEEIYRTLGDGKAVPAQAIAAVMVDLGRMQARLLKHLSRMEGDE